jgi:broad specificity phosphatase PhoE
MSSTQTIARASSSQAPTRSPLTPNGERIARRYRRRLRGMDLLEAIVYFSVAISSALDLAVVTDKLAVLAVKRDGELVGNAHFRALVAR